VVVNGLPLELVSGALSGLNIANCEHGCARLPCGPGTCLPHLAAFSCQCPAGWHGPTCGTAVGGSDETVGGRDDAATMTPSGAPSFSGDSFLFFNNEEIHQK
jgi:hypothetical protein